MATRHEADFKLTEFSDEVKQLALATTVSILKAETKESLTTKKVAHADLQRNKSSSFYKAMCLLPAGMELMKQASTVYDQTDKDAALITELATLNIADWAIAVREVSSVVQEGVVQEDKQYKHFQTERRN